MPASRVYRDKRPITFNLEGNKREHFEDICGQERKTMTEKLNELVDEAIKIRGLAEVNPLHISYGNGNGNGKQQQLQQSDLRQWLPYKQALHLARKSNLTKDEWGYLAKNIQTINRKVQTGYLNKD